MERERIGSEGRMQCSNKVCCGGRKKVRSFWRVVTKYRARRKEVWTNRGHPIGAFCVEAS